MIQKNDLNLWWMYINNKKSQLPVSIDDVQFFCNKLSTIDFDICKPLLVKGAALRFADIKIRLKKISLSDLNQSSINEAL